MKRVVIVAAIFTCFLTSSIQSITWKNYVTQNGIPKVVNGRLDLSYKDLEDIDFKDIEDIKTLKYLDLSYNCRLQKLPADLSSLANLEILILNSTKLQELPSSIGQLENLKELILHYNELQSLPETIGKLKKLEKINIYHNRLRTLPDGIGRLRNVKFINLNWNLLRSLPNSFGQLNLQGLYLFPQLYRILAKR